MADNTQALARSLADAEHDLDCHIDRHGSSFFDALSARGDAIRAGIPDEVYFTPEFFAAYGERRAERNAQAERGRPFTLIEGSAR
jgi:hypothetical protein